MHLSNLAGEDACSHAKLDCARAMSVPMGPVSLTHVTLHNVVRLAGYLVYIYDQAQCVLAQVDLETAQAPREPRQHRMPLDTGGLSHQSAYTLVVKAHHPTILI